MGWLWCVLLRVYYCLAIQSFKREIPTCSMSRSASWINWSTKSETNIPQTISIQTKFSSVTVDHRRSIEDVLSEAFYPFFPSLVFSQSLISLDLIEDFLSHAHQTQTSGNPLYEGRRNPVYKGRLNPLHTGRLISRLIKVSPEVRDVTPSPSVVSFMLLVMHPLSRCR